uniref:hypothetical protein n=1 Tax=Acetatifactor aquisgranensis TaxID=2941233 RepID=UPI00203F90E7
MIENRNVNIIIDSPLTTPVVSNPTLFFITKTLIYGNVINLRKRTIPDVFTPIHGIKTSGI